MKTCLRFSASVSVCVLILCAAGCGGGPKLLTGDVEGRRAGLFDVDGKWLAYEWTPAQKISTQTHIVLRDLGTGTETELESDLANAALAMDGGRLAYVRHPSNGATEVVLYDANTGTKTTAGEGRIQSIDISGDNVVWELNHSNGADIVIYNVTQGAARNLTSDGAAGGIQNSDPHIDVGTVAWVRYDRKKSEYAVYVHDLYTNKTMPTAITASKRIMIDVGGEYIAYCIASSGERSVRVYHTPTGADTELVRTSRFVGGPSTDGKVVAWLEHIPKEEFKALGGHPLIDERDFRSLYRCSVGGGTPRRVASNLFALNRVKAGPGGKLYATMPRGLHPAGQSNLGTPVDVCRW